eukprot:CAMPEP_0184679362 /NCGR_PEP_ID=MMETSP0312-20130426/2197_1 /TAXON_ID=31354 /ORGANISM="Compsopogon coeruleus, Strain SAG 36.94" /LENGTH=187 /DNA_ID=CAMNT_0027128753 /DNA_START=431 /DNA_END=994 /DNA_ORIENTATION=-
MTCSRWISFLREGVVTARHLPSCAVHRASGVFGTMVGGYAWAAWMLTSSEWDEKGSWIGSGGGDRLIPWIVAWGSLHVIARWIEFESLDIQTDQSNILSGTMKHGERENHTKHTWITMWIVTQALSELLSIMVDVSMALITGFRWNQLIKILNFALVARGVMDLWSLARASVTVARNDPQSRRRAHG